MIDFMRKLANYVICPMGDIFKSILRGFDPDNLGCKDIFYSVSDILPKRMTPKREQAIALVKEYGTISRGELKKIVSSEVIKSLVETGTLLQTESLAKHSYHAPQCDYHHPNFGNDQKNAIAVLQASLAKGGFSCFLLDGVTGSGKTEVFLEAAADIFKLGKQVLILMPEIGLTYQVAKRFEKRFGTAPAIWHSGTKDKERRFIREGVSDGTLKIVIGARSSLFLPFHDLGLIVVDEEHDSSYKQEEGMRYHARDMAVLRARCEECHIILASATPSLETFVNAEIGRYQKLILRERFGGASLPDIQMIDLTMNPPPKGEWISPVLRKAIMETASRGEQSLLFLNRRGYAPLMLCRGCGHRIQCPFCAIWMVYHHEKSLLRCHQCGQSSNIPKQCTACGASDKFVPCGPGVERLYEEVTKHFPHLHTIILSSDHQDNPDALRDLLKDMQDGNIHILIGTQMVAKGHHFPNLTTVGVIDADLSLGGGDLRSGERTFQLLEQVSGRAGRADKAGQVFLQSYNIGHPVMFALVNRDRDGFLDREAETRLEIGHPPFGRLAALIVTGEDKKILHDYTHHLAKMLPVSEGITVFGPAPAPLAMLRNKYRYRFLIKTDRHYSVQNFIRYWLKLCPVPRNLKLYIDIDPISFL